MTPISKRGKTKLAPLMKKQNHKCYYCARKCYYTKMPYATIDHVIPASSPEGKNTRDNKVMALCLWIYF